jgi:hypothetical protein
MLPEGAVEKEGIAKKINFGSVTEMLVNILQDKEDDLLISELSDDQYESILPVLKEFGVAYKVVINVPDIVTPRCFLFEDPDYVISYDLLELKEKSDADKLFEELDVLDKKEQIEDIPDEEF